MTKQIDDVLAQLKKIDVVEKAVAAQKKQARAQLAELIELEPGHTYENSIAKVIVTKDSTSRKVNYDMLLGMVGEVKYNKLVTTTTKKGAVKTTWK